MTLQEFLSDLNALIEKANEELFIGDIISIVEGKLMILQGEELISNAMYADTELEDEEDPDIEEEEVINFNEQETLDE